jgi:two-component system LytT family response regulator
MQNIETKLDPNKILRIHRSVIVNVERIKEMHPMFNGDYAVILRDKTELPLNRNYRDRLQSLLD